MNQHLEARLTITSNLFPCTESSGQEKPYLSDLKGVTKIIKKESHPKRSYVNIPDELRLQLVDAVFKHGESILCAAKRLKINYSAAKTICRVYKMEGRTNKKASRGVSLRDKHLSDTVKEEDENKRRSYEKQSMNPTQRSIVIFSEPSMKPCHKGQHDEQTKDSSQHLSFSQSQSFDPRTFQKLEQTGLNHEIFLDYSLGNISSFESYPSRNMPEFSMNLSVSSLMDALPPTHIPNLQTQMGHELGFTILNYPYGDHHMHLAGYNLSDLKKINAPYLPFYEDAIQLKQIQNNLRSNLNYQASQIFPLSPHPTMYSVTPQDPSKIATPINREPYFVFVVPSHLLYASLSTGIDMKY